MGLFDGLQDYINPGLVAGPIGAVAYNQLDIGGNKAQGRLDAYQQQQAAARAAAKQNQYNLLGQMQGPVVTPQMQARIKALEDESKLNLRQDPAFQSQVRQATSGGAQALGSIQNKQAATGASGGFSNIGSMNDVYDRLGGQLASLAQNQNMYAQQKRDTAAQLQQGIADAQMNYNNSITQAKIAIESGDAAAAQQAMAQAYAAKEQIQNNSRQMLLGIGSLGVTALTGMPSGAPQTQAPAQQQPTTYSPAPAQQIPLASTNYWNNQMNQGFQPYYQMR